MKVKLRTSIDGCGLNAVVDLEASRARELVAAGKAVPSNKQPTVQVAKSPTKKKAPTKKKPTAKKTTKKAETPEVKSANASGGDGGEQQ